MIDVGRWLPRERKHSGNPRKADHNGQSYGPGWFASPETPNNGIIGIKHFQDFFRSLSTVGVTWSYLLFSLTRVDRVTRRVTLIPFPMSISNFRLLIPTNLIPHPHHSPHSPSPFGLILFAIGLIIPTKTIMVGLIPPPFRPTQPSTLIPPSPSQPSPRPKGLKEHVDQQRQQAEGIAHGGAQQHGHGRGLPLRRQHAAGDQGGTGGAAQGLAR